MATAEMSAVMNGEEGFQLQAPQCGHQLYLGPDAIMATMVNGNLGLPTEVLENIIAYMLGSLPRIPPDMSNPTMPITLLKDAIGPDFYEETNFMTLSLVCRLWYQLATVQFYASVQLPELVPTHWPALLDTLEKHKQHIYRLTIATRVHAKFPGQPAKPWPVPLAYGSSFQPFATSELKEFPRFTNLRHLVVTWSLVINLDYPTVVKTVADLSSLEALGLHYILYTNRPIPENNIALPPQLSTLDVHPIFPMAPSLPGWVPFHDVFKNSVSIANLRISVSYANCDYESTFEILQAMGKHLVHLDISADFCFCPPNPTLVTMPNLKHLELGYPIDPPVLEALTLPSIETLTINKLYRTWYWPGNPQDLFSTTTRSMVKEFDTTFEIISCVFIGEKKQTTLQRLILSHLRLDPDSPLHDGQE